jgi:transposase
MQKSLEGFYKPEQLFALKQHWDQYVFSEKQIADCDVCIDLLLQKLTVDKPEPVLNKKPKRIYYNKPRIENLDKKMQQIYDGKDLTVLPAMTSYSLLKFFSVTGSDLRNWETEKRFAAWLGLAPTQYQSGQMKKYRRIKTNTQAGQILKECVQPLLRSKHLALGVFGKRISSRRGPNIAIKAMARKLACWIYRIVTKGWEFVENGIKQYEDRSKKDSLKWLQKQAKELNYSLAPL